MRKQGLIIVPVIGMSGEHCAQMITSALQNIAGISEVHVEVNNQRVLFGIKDRALIKEVVHSIRSLGFEVYLESRVFPVEGMTCAACAGSVETILLNEQGVVDATVNLANNSVRIDWFPEIIAVSRFKDALE